MKKNIYLINKKLFKRNKNIINQGIKINILGDINKFSLDLKFTLNKTMKLTKKIKNYCKFSYKLWLKIRNNSGH